MSKIAEWLADKPPTPAAYAVSIATYGNVLYDFLHKTNNLSLNNLASPHVKQWLSFYLRGKQVQKEIISSVFRFFDSSAKAIWEEFVSQVKASPNDHSHIKKLCVDLAESNIDDENTTQNTFSNDCSLHTPEVVFFLKVIFPCWFFYAQNHSVLFRDARHGNLDALEKLIRLDKAVVGDRLISEQIHKASSCDPRKLTIISKAINGRPKAKITIKKIKVSLAGLIAVSSEKSGHKFNAPEIQNLFDAIAIDHGLDELRDPDLHDTPESFAKAIKREEEFWQSFVQGFDIERLTKLITGQK